MRAAREREVACPACKPTVLMRLAPSMYRDGFYYRCPNYVRCRGTVTAHPDGKPAGVPGDAVTKGMRQHAHKAFDQLWKGKNPRFTRQDAYRVLQRAMNLSEREAHIGKFSADQCQALIDKIEAMKKGAP